VNDTPDSHAVPDQQAGAPSMRSRLEKGAACLYLIAAVFDAELGCAHSTRRADSALLSGCVQVMTLFQPPARWRAGATPAPRTLLLLLLRHLLCLTLRRSGQPGSLPTRWGARH
jgi:hypothetical protein